MFKEVVVPSAQNPVYQFPKEAYGKKVVVSIEYEENEANQSSEALLNTSDSPVNEFPFNKVAANDNRSFDEKYQEAVAFFKAHSIEFDSNEKWSRDDLYDE